MRAAEQFAKRHAPVESHAQIASAAESSISRTRRSLSLRTSCACSHTGLTPEGVMLDSGHGKGRDTAWRGIHGAVNMLPADTSLYTRSSLRIAEDRHMGYKVCSLVPSLSARNRVESDSVHASRWTESFNLQHSSCCITGRVARRNCTSRPSQNRA